MEKVSAWMTVPSGAAAMTTAVLCLAVTIASRVASGGREPSSALAPFFALLAGTAAHFANGQRDLHTARVVVAGAFLVSSFWTGTHSSILTQGVATVVWCVLQLSSWRSVVPGTAGAAGSGQWFDESVSPRAYLAGAVLCVGSFAATDWLDRGAGAGPGFLAGRALFSLLLLPALSAEANLVRAKDEHLNTDAGAVMLTALTVPLVGAFASSGPWCVPVRRRSWHKPDTQ